MSDTLKDLAQKFLQEAVFASREQSHKVPVGDAAGCGLGQRPAIPDSFSQKQAELLERMMEVGKAPDFAALQDVAEGWIKLQDGLDRKRNHFLKDFRNQHGFNRREYPPDVDAEFAAGVAAVNEENRARLEAHADQVVALFS
jgi:hypothetical protein